MSHTSDTFDHSSLERVIVTDGNNEKEVGLHEEKRDDNNALVHIIVFGETAGRKFLADQHDLVDDETVADAPRRFAVKDIFGGHPLDLNGNIIRGNNNKKKKKKPRPQPGGDLKSLASETH